jgi:hypothetical protein
MIALAITIALVLVGVGAYLRARSWPSDDFEPIEHSHDDRWGGDK